MDHKTRRRDMLTKHPELRKLIGPDWRSKYIALTCACLHVGIANWASTIESPALYAFFVYACGATLSQAGFLAVHELLNLFFTSGKNNRFFSMLINFPLVFPFAIAFREYHMLHHAHQGDSELDLDLPSAVETKLFRGRFGKLCWLAFQLVFYALRPCVKHPIAFSSMLVCNVTLQIAFDTILVHYLGWATLRFLFLSVILAGGLHPCSGHFLSEHFMFDVHASDDNNKTQDTFAYYGPLNWLTWNVGYHVEHHDIPGVPGSRLPQIRQIAPSFYSGLKTCPSWTNTLVKFVVNDEVTLHNRHVHFRGSRCKT